MVKNCQLFLASLCFALVTLLFFEESSAEPRRRSRARHRTIYRAVDDDDEDSDRPLTPSSNGKWISDDEVTIKNNRVTCKMDELEKCNAMWKDGEGFNEGEHYWEIYFNEIGSNGAYVGLTNVTRFKAPKSKITGLLYGSMNLGNGINDNLVWEYGGWFKPGDTVGVLASFSEKSRPRRLKVYYYINNVSLGLAYSVEKNVLSNIHPMVQFRDKGIVTITKKRERDIPKKRERDSVQEPGFEGYWRLDKSKKIIFDEKEFKTSKLPQDVDGNNPNIVTAYIRPWSENYFVYVRIINNNFFKFVMKKDMKNSGSWKTSNLEKLNEPEDPISNTSVKQLWEKLQGMVKGGTIKFPMYTAVFTKGGEDVNKVSFGRWKRTFEPYMENPFEANDVDQCSCPCQNMGMGWKPENDDNNK